MKTIDDFLAAASAARDAKDPHEATKQMALATFTNPHLDISRHKTFISLCKEPWLMQFINSARANPIITAAKIEAIGLMAETE